MRQELLSAEDRLPHGLEGRGNAIAEAAICIHNDAMREDVQSQGSNALQAWQDCWIVYPPELDM